MAEKTKFERIKRVVDEEKTKKVRGEAKLSSLNEERERIFKQINEEANRKISSEDEAEAMLKEVESSIHEDIEKVENVFKEEGIRF